MCPEKLSHLSCGIFHILQLADHALVVVFEGLARVLSVCPCTLPWGSLTLGPHVCVWWAQVYISVLETVCPWTCCSYADAACPSVRRCTCTLIFDCTNSEARTPF